MPLPLIRKLSMKNKFYLILALACVLCFTTSLAAQDADKPEKPKAAKKAKAKKARKSPYTKLFGGVEFTETQKTQLTELASAKKKELLVIRKGVGELVSKEKAKSIRLAVRKSVKGGMSETAAQKAAWEEVGLSVENQAKLTQLYKQRTELEQGLVKEIVATFSDEQKAAMKAGLEKAKKGSTKGSKKKKGKNKKGKKEQDDKKPEEQN